MADLGLIFDKEDSHLGLGSGATSAGACTLAESLPLNTPSTE